MNKFKFTKAEVEYLEDIHKILKFGEAPNMFYAIGYDKKTNERKIFLFNKEDDRLFIIAEIQTDSSTDVDDVEFNFDAEETITYQYGRQNWMAKLWRRLTQR